MWEFFFFYGRRKTFKQPETKQKIEAKKWKLLDYIFK